MESQLWTLWFGGSSRNLGVFCLIMIVVWKCYRLTAVSRGEPLGLWMSNSDFSSRETGKSCRSLSYYHICTDASGYILHKPLEFLTERPGWCIVLMWNLELYKHTHRSCTATFGMCIMTSLVNLRGYWLHVLWLKLNMDSSTIFMRGTTLVFLHKSAFYFTWTYLLAISCSVYLKSILILLFWLACCFLIWTV